MVELGPEPALFAGLAQRERHQGPVVPLVREVDAAGGSAMASPEYLLRIEIPDLRLRCRRESNSLMELKDRELDEEEPVLAPVAPLETALLDFAPQRSVRPTA
jgi:hypothetical protein